MSEAIIKKEQHWRTNTTLSQDLETLEINPYLQGHLIFLKSHHYFGNSNYPK